MIGQDQNQSRRFRFVGHGHCIRHPERLACEAQTLEREGNKG